MIVWLLIRLLVWLHVGDWGGGNICVGLVGVVVGIGVRVVAMSVGLLVNVRVLHLRRRDVYIKLYVL